MRVQCDVCHSAVAAVLCCADQAALCLPCDHHVHAANKLANRHQRVALLYNVAPNLPPCDICQESTAFIFCLEDRALLCRDCDVSIHSLNPIVSAHQRFLATGVPVALNDVASQHASANRLQGEPDEPTCVMPSLQASRTSNVSTSPVPGISQKKSSITKTVCQNGFVDSVKRDSVSSSAWRVDELLNLPDLAAGYNLGKAELPSPGEYDWMADLAMFDEHLYTESLAEVPQISSATSGSSQPGKLNMVLKGKHKHDLAFVPECDDAFVVPDLGLQSDHVPPLPVKRLKTFIGV